MYTINEDIETYTDTVKILHLYNCMYFHIINACDPNIFHARDGGYMLPEGEFYPKEMHFYLSLGYLLTYLIFFLPKNGTSCMCPFQIHKVTNIFLEWIRMYVLPLSKCKRVKFTLYI